MSCASSRTESLKLLTLLLLTLVLLALLSSHFFLNGSRFHPWTWHWGPLRFIPLFLLAALPFALAQFLHDKLHLPARFTLPPLMLALLAMQIVSAIVQDHDLSLAPISRQAESHLITSYLTDARALAGAHVSTTQILATYPNLLPSFHLHSKSKPPGPLLYWYFLLGLSPTAAPLLGSLLIGALSTLSIPAIYWFTKTITADRDGAFTAASYFTLTPAAIVFLPQFDQIYPAFACILLTTWILSLRTGQMRWMLTFALTLTAITFSAYNLLVLGIFICGFTFLHFRTDRAATARRSLTTCALTITFLLAFYLLLHLATGYNPIATFRAVLHEQSQMKAELHRPWLATIPADFIDLALGAGWLALPLLIFYFLKPSPHRPLVLLALSQILVVSLTGLLPGETSRVWLFMLPLLLLPVSLELSGWLPQHRWTTYLCLFLLTLATSLNIRFH